MKATFKLPASELARLNVTLRQWAGFTGKEMETAVREESRLLLRDCINLTPPTVRGSSNQFQTIAPQSQRRAAIAAIEKDVKFRFKPLQDVTAYFEKLAAGKGKRGQKSQKVDYARVLAYIKQYAGEGRARAIETILRGGFHRKVVVVNKASAEMYHELKGRKGYKLLVVDSASIDAVAKAIIKAKSAKVGFAKSGWNKSARGLGLGAKLPKWIAGKAGPGDFRTEGGGVKFAITLQNSVPFVQRFGETVTTEALRRRTRSLENRMRAMTEKLAKRGD